MRTERTERGFVLVSVLLIALLYFALIELILADATRKSREAQRFRARITANILAENGAELAASRMVQLDLNEAKLECEAGSMSGQFRRVGDEDFVIHATGISGGTVRSSQQVVIRGTIRGDSVTIAETRHDR